MESFFWVFFEALKKLTLTTFAPTSVLAAPLRRPLRAQQCFVWSIRFWIHKRQIDVLNRKTTHHRFAMTQNYKNDTVDLRRSRPKSTKTRFEIFYWTKNRSEGSGRNSSSPTSWQLIVKAIGLRWKDTSCTYLAKRWLKD